MRLARLNNVYSLVVVTSERYCCYWHEHIADAIYNWQYYDSSEKVTKQTLWLVATVHSSSSEYVPHTHVHGIYTEHICTGLSYKNGYGIVLLTAYPLVNVMLIKLP